MLRFFNHYIALPTILLAAVEAILFFGLLLAMTVFKVGAENIDLITDSLDLLDLAIVCTFFLLLLASIGLYNRDAVFQVGILLQRSVIFLFIVVFLGFISWVIDDVFESTRLSSYTSLLAVAAALNFLVIVTIRSAFIYLPKYDAFKRRILVVGRGQLGHRIESFLVGAGSNTLLQVGYLNLEDFDATSDSEKSSGRQTNQAVSDLRMLAHEKHADEIVIASKEWRGLPVWELLECKMSGIAVTDFLTFWERETGQIDLDEVKPSWLAFSDGFRVSHARSIVKRAFDVVVSLTFIALTFPLLMITAAIIKIESPGPVFYRQERVGLDGRVFRVIKFRSMRDDAEKDGVPQWASTIDPRITKVGHFIRRSRIDEIPQIINVLLGQMSFVGPRPERPFFVKDLEDQIPLYSLRHNVRPGITGWAQVNYRYAASVDDAKNKLAYDLYYVKNGGFFLDIVIILQTVRVVLSGDGAR